MASAAASSQLQRSVNNGTLRKWRISEKQKHGISNNGVVDDQSVMSYTHPTATRATWFAYAYCMRGSRRAKRDMAASLCCA